MIHQNSTPELQAGELLFRDIDLFYNFEALVDGVAIAQISFDSENSLKPWVVYVSEVEVYRAAVYADAETWVETSYRFNTLNSQLKAA